jgi:hypothetical protein
MMKNKTAEEIKACLNNGTDKRVNTIVRAVNAYEPMLEALKRIAQHPEVGRDIFTWANKAIAYAESEG